jgi:hypothetical protein
MTTQSLLFGGPAPIDAVRLPTHAVQPSKPELNQFFTPAWAAEALVEQFFSDLSSSDLVLEPSCGKGAFLQAIPAHVPALGVEIDPNLAIEAARTTGREVITGDFCSVELPAGITAMIGNPPFELSLVERLLARAAPIIPMEGRCGFVLPAYFFQTHGTVERFRHQWAIQQQMIPRTLFPGLSKPLVFALFTRSTSRALFGFCLYDQAVQFDQLAQDAQRILTAVAPRRSSWHALVENVLAGFGGCASLQDIYQAVAPRRPTGNPWWKEQIRKVLQQHFTRTTTGDWCLPAAA